LRKIDLRKLSLIENSNWFKAFKKLNILQTKIIKTISLKMYRESLRNKKVMQNNNVSNN